MLEGNRLPPCLPACLPAFGGRASYCPPLPQVRPGSGQEDLGITFPSGHREEYRLPRRGCSGHGWDSPPPAAASSDTPGCRWGTGALARPRTAGWHQGGGCAPVEPAEIPRCVRLVAHLLFRIFEEVASGFPTLPFWLCHGAGGGSALPAGAGLWPARLLLPSELPAVFCRVAAVLLKWQPFGHRGITLHAAFACRGVLP